MKAYIGKEKFSEEWDADLDNCISVYDFFPKMCNVTEEEKFQSFPIRMSGDALNNF